MTTSPGTQLGTLSTRDRALVDGRGTVTPGAVGWALEWWIGAEDRWYVVAREPGARQSRVDAAPVVETAMKVPGGDAVHRAYAAQVSGEPVVVVEIENRTAVPFAVALVVVPRTPAGGGARRIVVRDATVEVDGRPGLVFGRRPARAAAGRDGELLEQVLAGAAGDVVEGELVRRDAGDACAALVVPVSHRTSVRVLLPLRSSSCGVLQPGDAPGAADVARGWTSQVDRGPRVEVPDDRFRRAFDAARRDVLLAPTGEDVVVWPDRALSWTGRARVVEALDLLGYHDEAEQVVGAIGDEQRLNGAIESPDGALGANGAALWSIGRHWQLTRDDELVERLVGPIAKAGHWIDKRRTARRVNLLRHGSAADVAWSIAGLRTVADALAATGQPEVAEDLVAFADRLAAEAAGVDATGRRPMAGPAVDLALAALVRGERRDALALVSAALDQASPVSTWPSADGGPDVEASAAYCTFLRHALVIEQPAAVTGAARARELWLCNLVPDEWLGQSWEVRDLPTTFGRLGYAVRWHGDRPALLWELEPHERDRDDQPVALRAPGLDAGWASVERRGEALLGAVPAPTERPGGVGEAGASSSFT